jgi:hypothetical protein
VEQLPSPERRDLILAAHSPFDPIKHHHPIDDTCPARGNVPDPPPASDPNSPAHALQNLAKNNFCATGGPALVTFTSFKKPQSKLDQKVPATKTWTRDHLPADRSVLIGVHTTSGGDTVGEGSVVRFAAWVMMLRGNSVESSNCETSGKNEDTDIHVVLISSSDRENTAECSSVTAEVSPHSRPETWDSHHLLLANAHPLRLTGQLFCDAAHRPCSESPPKAASRTPTRVSSWEIHPVYAIDVCNKKSLTTCKAQDDSLWTALDQWRGDQ